MDSILDFADAQNAFAPALTYEAAGVSTQRGDELVDRIKQFCKATRRKGCDADLGGYGALFDIHVSGISWISFFHIVLPYCCLTIGVYLLELTFVQVVYACSQLHVR
jgi:hypothetical protein